jgi:hypothetical protein
MISMAFYTVKLFTSLKGAVWVVVRIISLA